MNDFQVIDNFLEDSVIDEFIETYIDKLNPNLRWIWFPKSTSSAEDDGQFVNIIFSENIIHDDTLVPLCSYVETEIVKKLKSRIRFDRIKINAIQKGFKDKFETHQDSSHFGFKSLILYFNDTDGATFFNIHNKEKKIECKKNRAVIFDSNIPHYNCRQTDKKLRVVLNMVFEVL